MVLAAALRRSPAAPAPLLRDRAAIAGAGSTRGVDDRGRRCGRLLGAARALAGTDGDGAARNGTDGTGVRTPAALGAALPGAGRAPASGQASPLVSGERARPALRDRPDQAGEG